MIDLSPLGPYACAFARTAAFLHAAPLVGDKAVPPRIRVAAAVVLTGVFGSVHAPVALGELFTALPGELLVGAACGFGARLALAGVESGGHLIGLHLGLGFAESFDPSLGEHSTAVRRLFSALAGLAFLASGGLDGALAALSLPLPNGPSILATLGNLVDRGGDVLLVALRIAGPVLVATFIANLAAALASRAAPALNVFSVALALVVVVGVLVLRATSAATMGELFAGARQAVALAGGSR